MATRHNFWSDWQDRLSALRNVPVVLRIVWESGASFVAFNLIFRVFSSLLPMALLWVTKLIIDIIQRVVSTHEPIPERLWYLVAIEFGLAVLASVLSRT